MSKRAMPSAEAEGMDQAAQDELARSIEVHIRAPLEQARLELMPFHLDADGPANVSQFFLPKPAQTWEQDSSAPVLGAVSSSGKAAETQPARFVADFRGREVVAYQVDLPADTCGLVFVPEQPKPPAGSSSGPASKRLKAAARLDDGDPLDPDGGGGEDDELPSMHWGCSQSFESLRVWNVDREHLGSRTSVGRALESQMALSRALHAPVEVDE